MKNEYSNKIITNLEANIGYNFKQSSLLIQAITHRSANSKNNERLEFLGDSILNFTIADRLYQKFNKANEGELSRMRASLVKEQTLAQIANNLNLGEFLLLGSGEKKSGGRRRSSILSDCVEAILGAIYLDSDLDTARKILSIWFQGIFDKINPNENQKDPKTRLQEYLQGKHLPLPNYEVVNISGEAHCQIFKVKCNIISLNQDFIAKAGSVKKAEQACADMVLKSLNIND